MIELINKLTGTPMWVDESRVADYMAKGHTLAVDVEVEKPAEPAKVGKPQPKKTVKKTTKKK